MVTQATAAKHASHRMCCAGVVYTGGGRGGQLPRSACERKIGVHSIHNARSILNSGLSVCPNFLVYVVLIILPASFIVKH